MKIRLLPILLLATSATAVPASAASSVWAEVEGGAVRVVTEGLPDGEGRLRGALEIRLEPGWKTYWRDPGEAGIPPTVTIAEPEGAAGVEIGFPAPKRHDDGYSVWAGYDRPVALALTFDLPEDRKKLDVSVFLGICEIICIPVQADFSIDLTDTSNATHDRGVVEGAFAALPRPAGDGFGAVLREANGEHLVIDVEAPSSADPELFVASTGTWAFGTPRRVDAGPRTAFSVPVLSAPDGPADAEAIHYTLVAGEEAVSGTFELSR